MTRTQTLAAIGASTLALASQSALAAVATPATGEEQPIGDQRFWFEPFPKQTAEYATKWREAREKHGLPIPTAKMVEKAQRLIERIPTLRARYNSPLGLQQLAMSMPITRYDRQSLPAEERLKLEPSVIDKQDQQSVKADPEAVANWLTENPQIETPAEAVEALMLMHGYQNSNKPLRRVARWARNNIANPDAFPPTHIREKIVMLDACAVASRLVEEREAA